MLLLIAILSITTELLSNILVVLLGGIFGWVLGKMPQRWVYAIMALAIFIAMMLITGI